MPATFKPARASGSTATPPAAPKPTTATSTGFRLMAMALAGSAAARWIGRVMIGLDVHAHLLIVGRGGQTRPGISDEIPAREILVAAVVGIAEHAFQGEPPGAIEKRSGAWKSLGRAALHRGKNQVPLLRRKVDERPGLGPPGERIHRLQSFDER